MQGRRARDVGGLIAGSLVLVVGAAAARGGVSGAEGAVFHAVNDLPERAFPMLWGPMQFGAIGSVPVVSIGALAARRPRLAVGLAAAGTAAWFLAKAAKPLVGRGRPASTVEGAVIRGRDEDDRGFPSGHAAVSAALTTVMAPHLPKGWTRAPTALATVVPFARIYVGAHLPLDVVGGSAMGIAIGSAINLAFGVRRGAREHSDHKP